MTDTDRSCIGCTVVGFGLGALLMTAIFWIGNNLHTDHVRDYKACLALGAPAANCFDKYLVPKEER